MKCLITNDIHLGVSRNDSIWLDQTVKLIEQIIDECHKREIWTLYILGDFFDDRKNLYMKTLDTALRIAELLKKNTITTKILLGNHDVFYKTENTINSLEIFNEYDNIEVIKNTKVVDNVGIVPWNCEIPKDVEYLFGHFEINEFPVTNTRIFDKSNLNISNFSQYKKVISGHFHIPSSRQNITYLGAPFHLSFNDVGGTRGFYYFDSDIDQLEFIEFNGVRFVYVSSEEVPDKKKIENNVVRLIFEKDYGTVENNKRIERVQSCSPLRFHTDFSKLSNEISIDEQETSGQTMKSNKEILFDFIDSGDHPPHIEPKKMKNIIETLLEVV